MKKLLAFLVSTALFLPSSPLFAQKAGAPKKPAKGTTEVERLRAELAACRAAASDVDKAALAEAALAVQAVRSALKAGANLDEFKKYQIEAQIKVDRLPATEATLAVRGVAQIYQDALHMGLLKFNGTLSSERRAALLERYKDEPDISKLAEEMRATVDSKSWDARQNEINGEYFAQVLLVLAEKRHAALLPSPPTE